MNPEENKIYKIEILLEQKKFSLAEKFLLELLTHERKNLNALYLLAETYLQQNKNEEANGIIDIALKISPENPYLLCSKSKILLLLNHFLDSEKFISEAIRLDPYNPYFHMIIAQIQFSLYKYDESIKSLDKALELDPEDVQTLNIKSDLLNALDRTDESIENIKKTLNKDPNSAKAYSNYGWAFVQKGEPRKAIDFFHKALLHDPSLQSAHDGLLQTFRKGNIFYRTLDEFTLFAKEKISKNIFLEKFLLYSGLKFLYLTIDTIVYFSFCFLAAIGFSDWLFNPIGRIILRFDKFGKILLNEKEKKSASYTLTCIYILVLGLVLFFILGNTPFLSICIFGLTCPRSSYHLIS